MMKIPNNKLQISNKFQYSNSNIQTIRSANFQQLSKAQCHAGFGH